MHEKLVTSPLPDLKFNFVTKVIRQYNNFKFLFHIILIINITPSLLKFVLYLFIHL